MNNNYSNKKRIYNESFLPTTSTVNDDNFITTSSPISTNHDITSLINYQQQQQQQQQQQPNQQYEHLYNICNVNNEPTSSASSSLTPFTYKKQRVNQIDEMIENNVYKCTSIPNDINANDFILNENQNYVLGQNILQQQPQTPIHHSIPPPPPPTFLRRAASIHKKPS